MTRIRLTEEEFQSFRTNHEQMPTRTSFVEIVARYHSQGQGVREITDKIYRMRGGADPCAPPWKLANPNRADDDYIALESRVNAAISKLENEGPEPPGTVKERGGRR